MTDPGWYPDPGGAGNRYWNGQTWTDQVQAPPRVGKGIAGWVLVLWFVLMTLIAFGGFWYVVLMTAFGCDSGWDGCVGVGQTTWLVYVGVCLVGLVGLLIWALVSQSPGVRVAAFFLMPGTVVVALVLATALYFGLASWLA